MGERRHAPSGALVRVGTRLQHAMWLVLAVGLVGGLVSTGGRLTEAPAEVVLTALSVFFVVVGLRVLVGALADRTRRTARFVLLGSIGLWAAGSAALHQGQVSEQEFPGPAEYFFLPAYIGFVAFLLLDSRRSRGGLRTWLETLATCGALVCVAAGLLATPAAAALPVHGIGLLLFLFYPLLDFTLLVVLVGQLVLGVRGRGRGSVLLLAGTGLLVGLDLHYAIQVADGVYFATLGTDALYGLSFGLIATGACASRSLPLAVRPTRSRAFLLVVAASFALVALAVRPTGDDSVLVTVPAILTLVAVLARLVLALRDAQGAAEARRLSRTDELTGLLNRRAVVDDLGASLAAQRPVALLLMDLDGFKDVNDTLGHTVGDQLLQEVAHRLVLALPGTSRVARLGGDEFAAVVTDADDVQLLLLARDARRAVSQRVRVDGVDMVVGASVGITRSMDAASTAVEMLRRADVAMYRAKQGRLGQALYDPAHDGFTRDRLQQVELLRAGIEGGQLRLWYQPLVDAATQSVTAVEALVRWQHPTMGLLQPVAFLPEARRAGLMGPLSDAVVDLVVADAARWHRAGHSFQVAFNAAPPELLGGRLVRHLLAELDRADLPPGRVTVEVTEDSFVSDPDRARDVLRQLREHHVGVAIDDYGTGFSSLAYLRDLPVQTLKLDRSFVRGLERDDARAIVESTLHLAHALGLELVAEGVEDAATAAALVQMGVDVLQGYHVARPMPADELAGWVARWHSSLEASVRGSTGA